MDPLSALRDFTIRGELDKIIRVNDEFRFGSDFTFPCFAETAYRSEQGNLYTLETLVHYIKHHHVKHTEYIQNARTQGIPSVTFPDRKPLLDYLTGKISSSDSIEFVLPQTPKFPDPPQNDVAQSTPDINNHNDDDHRRLAKIAKIEEAAADYMLLIYAVRGR